MSDIAPYPAVADIGGFDAPLLICGGAYSNLEALTALLEAAERLNVPPTRIVHTGDVVAYGADPAATAELLRESGAHAIKGNVEEQLAAGADDCACGFEEGSVCNALSAAWYAHADARIDAGLRAWMAGLPDQLTFRLAGKRFRVVHGGVAAINRFIYPSSSDQLLAEELDLAEADAVIGGHSGLPFTRVIGGRLWHNSGALGLPANDGTPRVWYALIEPRPAGASTGGTIAIRHLSLAYDHLSAQRKMREAGLPEGYAATLSTGLLPQGSDLPQADWARRGVALVPEQVAWKGLATAAA